MSKYEQIAEALKNDILAGRLSSPLPPERTLAVRFDVSYVTMRNAIGELVKRGMLSREHGRGVFLKTPERSGSKTLALGFVVPERILSADGLLSPFYGEVFAGAAQEAQKLGYHIIVDSKVENLMSLEGRCKVDAVFAVCPDDMACFDSVARFLPVIVLGHNYPGVNYPAVYIDDFRAAYEAVSYLIEVGHRSIAHFYGAKANWSFYQRLAGYRKALEYHDIPVSAELEFGGGEDTESFVTANIGRGKQVTAIFCHNDPSAFRLMNLFSEKGIKVPNDVSVVGFDDLPYSCIWCPPLTSVFNPKAELGRRGVIKAVKFLNNELRGEEFREELQCKLMLRKTVSGRIQK